MLPDAVEVSRRHGAGRRGQDDRRRIRAISTTTPAARIATVVVTTGPRWSPLEDGDAEVDFGRGLGDGVGLGVSVARGTRSTEGVSRLA
jgi:hypothetical protein